MGTVLDGIVENPVIFDYTDFLSKSCQQQLSFMDALKYLVPLFEMTVKSTREKGFSSTEQLEKKALKVLSSNASDTQNLIRLLHLAKQDGIKQLIVSLPYSLEEHQLNELKKKLKCSIEFVEEDVEQLLFKLE